VRLRQVPIGIVGILLVMAAAAPPDASGAPAAALALDYEIVSDRPHDPDAFTEGLVLDGTGRLFESTGLQGRSSLRQVDPVDGEVLRITDLPDAWFGEGLALVDDRLVQLTWKDGIATAWDSDTFERLTTYEYEGEGWGLCFDGSRLVMSDGSERLTFRDPSTFEVLGDVLVTLDGAPQADLNELECVDGSVWANVYQTDRIVRIDPGSGTVTGTLDLDGIIHPDPADARPGAVLNGIAYDSKAGTLLVTGKLWPELFEIRVTEDDDGS
jgi:glutamine cyclotransferase